MPRKPVIVSACLLGLKTRHDGTDAFSEEAMAAVGDRTVVPVCPEQLGGLSTPRPWAEISGGDGPSVLEGMARVVDEHGADVTEKFLKGAEAVAEIARLTGAGGAILKEKSPSCAVSTVCRGKETIRGMGVTASLLARKKIELKGF